MARLSDEEKKIRNREKVAKLFAKYKRVDTCGTQDDWKKTAQMIMSGKSEVSDCATLGITSNFDEKSLKAAYREKMRNAHPDKGGSNDEAAKINEAYQRLKKAIPSKSVVDATNRVDTGLRSQLLNPIEVCEAILLLDDDEWGMQEKMDGKHIIVKVVSGVVAAANKQGVATLIPSELEADLIKLEGCIIDGELIGNELYVFDLLMLNNSSITNLSYSDRHDKLSEIRNSKYIKVVPLYIGEQKRKMWNKFKSEGYEGVVFKKLRSTWSQGRPIVGGNMLKCKFVATLSAVVSEESTGKNSFYSYVFDDNGNRVNLGRCTVQAGKKIPEAGTIVEIRYLYAYQGGCLIQPVFLGTRDDVSPDECSSKQIKLKRA